MGPDQYHMGRPFHVYYDLSVTHIPFLEHNARNTDSSFHLPRSKASTERIMYLLGPEIKYT